MKTEGWRTRKMKTSSTGPTTEKDAEERTAVKQGVTTNSLQGKWCASQALDHGVLLLVRTPVVTPDALTRTLAPTTRRRLRTFPFLACALVCHGVFISVNGASIERFQKPLQRMHSMPVRTESHRSMLSTPSPPRPACVPRFFIGSA